MHFWVGHVRMLLVVLAVVVPAATAFAQGGTSTATLSGGILDSTGGRLPGVTVTVTNLGTNQSRTVVSNEEGFYRFAGLAPGSYTLKAELEGFAPYTRAQLTLNVGSAVDQDITLGMTELRESVTVTGEAPIVESGKTDLSTVISKEQIEALPTRSRNYLDFALLTPGVVENVSTQQQGIGVNIAGARAKEGALLVDGFWNTDESFTFPRQKYSQDAIGEFQVVGLGGTAEFGRAIGGIVSAVTKSGTNEFRGSGYGYFRNTKLNAVDPLLRQRNIPKPDFDRQLYGFSLGGPVIRNRTFFFGAAERTAQNQPQDNNITQATAQALGLPPEDVGAIKGTLRDTFGLGKVNHSFSQGASLYGSFAITRDRDMTTPGAFAVRSRRQRLTSTDTSYQFGWTQIGGDGTWLHELRGSYFPRDYTLDAPNLGGPPLAGDGQLRSDRAPAVNITNVANFGGGAITLAQITKPVQVVYSTTLSKRSHAIKFGLDGMFVDFVYLRHTGPQTGTYTFANLAAFQRGQYSTYSQLFGESKLDRFHTYLSAYIQDSWQAQDRLTLNYGLRYDVEYLSKYEGLSYGQDNNNLGPRFALSWDLTGRGETLLKFSNGLYFDRIFQNPVTPTFFQSRDVLQQVSGVWRFGEPGAPTYPKTLAEADPSTVPAGVRDVYLPPSRMQVPASYQAVVSLDHAFNAGFAATVSLLYNRSWNKEVLFDRNLEYHPDTNSFTRPDRGFRRVLQYSYEGIARYRGVVLDARKRVTGKFFLSGSATFARAYDQGDNFSSQVNDPLNARADYGPSVDTPKVRVTANGSYEINRMMSISGVFRGRSGFAHSAIGGGTVDFNGDGAFNDRVPGTTRNEFRLPGSHSVDLRFTWTVPFGGAKRVQFTVDAFNVYNRDNVATVSNIWGSNVNAPVASFAQPLSYFNPREVQLAARFSF